MALPEVIKQLLENGVHFGHLSKHWNPKMKKFIFGRKKDVYIIDLEKTAQKIEEAKDFLSGVAQSGGKILFVATKKQLRELMKEQAVSCSMPYITERWVGGFLTNFSTIRSRVKRYINLTEKQQNGELSKLPRKEVVRINRELDKMHKIYQGVVSLEEMPACVYVVDTKKETACMREAEKLGIPIVALVDTDADPDNASYPIPGNDDAVKSVRCITGFLVEAIKKGVEKAADAQRLVKADGEIAESAAEPDVSKYDDLDEKLAAKNKEEKEAKRRASLKETA